MRIVMLDFVLTGESNI